MSVITFDYMNQYEHLPDTKIFTHSHVYFELVYYFEGRGTTTTPEAKYRYEPNTYVIYTPDLPHDEVHLEKTSVMCVGFFVHNHVLDIQPGLYSDRNHRIYNLLEKIKKEFRERKSHYNIMLYLLTSEMLIEHMREYHPVDDTFDQVYYIIHLIDNNFNSDIDTENLATMAGYSQDYFRHLFKEKTGFSPMSYIIHKRIENAKRLLTETDYQISDIALSCGFSSSSQFAMMFKRQEDLTPTQYRQRHYNQKDQNI